MNPVSTYTANLPIQCVPKPRMTRRDKWDPKPRVIKYRAFVDDLRSQLGDATLQAFNEGQIVMFEIHCTLSMPKSWSKKKKAQHDGQPHRQTPDIDNLAKGVLDAILERDEGVHDLCINKIWGYTPQLFLLVKYESK